LGTAPGRKIAGYLEDEDLKQDFLGMNERYWSQTRDAFEKGADAVKKEFEDYLEQLEKLSADEEEARQVAKQFEGARDFFRGIPL
jgi:septation ring formation regulator EzrA